MKPRSEHNADLKLVEDAKTTNQSIRASGQKDHSKMNLSQETLLHRSKRELETTLLTKTFDEQNIAAIRRNVIRSFVTTNEGLIPS